VKSEHLFCSRECHYKGRSIGLVKRICETPYQLSEETRQKFSRRLKAQNAKRVAEGRYAHSEATKQKLSVSVAKAISEGRISRVSGFEKRVGEILTAMGIMTEPQRGFRDTQGRFGAVVDFYLPHENLALEANGTFWHADPRVFPNGPTHYSQKRTLSRYEQKRAFLSSLGIRIIEVWELDFRQDPEGSVKAALGVS